MKHRTFGRTGIRVSEIVFGAGSVGGILIYKDDTTKREAIRRAFAGGINWIDTAAQYGNGKSEEALGWLLPESGAKPYLSTKFNLDVANLKTSRRRSSSASWAASPASSVHPWTSSSSTTGSARSRAAG
jgi:aryl-alcohol dehydrogenase-like predicted oxidoreductase